MPPEQSSRNSAVPAMDDAALCERSMNEDRFRNCRLNQETSDDDGVFSSSRAEDMPVARGEHEARDADDGEGIRAVSQATECLEELSLKEVERNEPRAFCWECHKAQSVCLCSRFKEKVPNRIGITILQVYEMRPMLLLSRTLVGIKEIEIENKRKQKTDPA